MAWQAAAGRRMVEGQEGGGEGESSWVRVGRRSHGFTVGILRLCVFLCLSLPSRPAHVDSGAMVARRQRAATLRERAEGLPFRLGWGGLRLRSDEIEQILSESMYERNDGNHKSEEAISPHTAPLCLRGGSGLPAGGQVVQCTYNHNWDTSGVFAFLGRMAANAAASSGQLPPGTNVDWLNPAMAGFVRVHCGEEGYRGYDSESFDIVLDKELVIDRKEVPGAAFFGDGWFIVELGPNFQLRPTHYTLRNGGGTIISCMTGWVLEGSQGVEGPWHTLDHRGSSENRLPMEEHQCCVFNDLAQQHGDEEWPHDSVTFPIAEGSQLLIAGELCPTPGHNNCGFRVFRLRQLLNRMPGSTNMYIQGFEVYGDLYIPPM